MRVRRILLASIFIVVPVLYYVYENPVIPHNQELEYFSPEGNGIMLHETRMSGREYIRVLLRKSKN
jgi:hypothetical protein